MKNIKLDAKTIKNNKMKLVHDDDLSGYLRSLGVYEDYIEGSCKCLFYNRTMNFENFYAILPYKNAITFCCNDFTCQLKLIKKEFY